MDIRSVFFLISVKYYSMRWHTEVKEKQIKTPQSSHFHGAQILVVEIGRKIMLGKEKRE